MASITTRPRSGRERGMPGAAVAGSACGALSDESGTLSSSHGERAIVSAERVRRRAACPKLSYGGADRALLTSEPDGLGRVHPDRVARRPPQAVTARPNTPPGAAPPSPRASDGIARKKRLKPNCRSANEPLKPSGRAERATELFRAWDLGDAARGSPVPADRLAKRVRALDFIVTEQLGRPSGRRS